jgi:hypothetical protein
VSQQCPMRYRRITLGYRSLEKSLYRSAKNILVKINGMPKESSTASLKGLSTIGQKTNRYSNTLTSHVLPTFTNRKHVGIKLSTMNAMNGNDYRVVDGVGLLTVLLLTRNQDLFPR